MLTHHPGHYSVWVPPDDNWRPEAIGLQDYPGRPKFVWEFGIARITNGNDILIEAFHVDEAAFVARRMAIDDGQAVLWRSWEGVDYWEYRSEIYSTRESLEPADVIALVHARQRDMQRTLARAHTLMAMDDPVAMRRETIPDDVKIFVWKRDEGRCVRCQSNLELEFDHIIPLAMGGSNSARNLQLLCGPCNRSKGAGLI